MTDFVNIDIFITLNLPVHRHSTSLHLFRSYLISFASILQFQHTYSAHILRDVQLSSLFFKAFVNGILYFNSIFMYSLLAYRNKIYFCILISCYTTLLNFFILVFCGFLDIFCIDSNVICKEGHFYLFLSDLFAFRFLVLLYCPDSNF